MGIYMNILPLYFYRKQFITKKVWYYKLMIYYYKILKYEICSNVWAQPPTSAAQSPTSTVHDVDSFTLQY